MLIKRLLLRLWLNVEDGRAMHPSFVERARAMDRLHEAGEPAIHYAKTGVLEDHMKAAVEAAE